MEVIPQKNVTEENLRKYEGQLANLQSLQHTTPSQQKRIQNLLAKRAECKFAIKNGTPVLVTLGNQMKGGALFLNAAKHYLKDISNINMPIEWRGGKLVVIVDEGVLNADEYMWSSAYSHIHNTHDLLLSDSILVEEICDWNSFLAVTDTDLLIKKIRKHVTTGRPLGGDCFIEEIERLTHRSFHRRRRV